MDYLVCVLNHKSRDISYISNFLKVNNVPFKVFTDSTDHKDNRKTRWLGLTLNYLSIIEYKTDAKWKIIIHDDVSFELPLFVKINHILQFAPKNLISFYNPTNKAYVDCYNKGKHILKTYSNWWSQCHAFPKELEEDLLKDCKANPQHVLKYAEDGLLSRYFSKYKIPLYAVVPSQVQHIGYDKSTFNLPAKCGNNLRNSATFDADFNVYFVDWVKEFNEPYLNLTTKSYD